MAVDTTLLDAIRSGTHARYHMLEFSRNDQVLRVWDGIGEIDIDGQTWSGRTGLIDAGGFANSADLSVEEVTLTLSHLVPEQLGETDLSIRGLRLAITAFWMDGGGNILTNRQVIYKGVSRTSNIQAAKSEATVQITFVPELLDTRRTRLTRYSVEDQAERYPDDTGLSDVAGLTNVQPVNWTISSSGGGDVIHVQWSESGSVVTLTDTANRPVKYGTDASFTKYACSGKNILLTSAPVRLLSKTLYLDSTKASSTFTPGVGYLCERWIRTKAKNGWRYYQLGYGNLHSKVTGVAFYSCVSGVRGSNQLKYNAKATALSSFMPIYLGSDGFVYASGAKLTVDQDTRNVVHNGQPINRITLDIPEHEPGWTNFSAQRTPVCAYKTFNNGNTNGENVMFASKTTTPLRSDIL